MPSFQRRDLLMSPILAALAIALTVPAQPIHHAEVPAPAHSAVASSPPIDRSAFHDAMRKLWEDHVTWTRLYIVSAAAVLPDAQAAAERLLRNQADIGDAIKPFYGETAGKRLTELLLSLIHISEPTRLGMISYAVFCLK